MIVGEYSYISKWGKDIYIRCHLVPMHDASGKIIGVQGIVDDFTECKKTEDELHTLYHAVEQSPVAVMITDIEGNIEYVNPKFNQLTGYTAEEIRGQNPRFLKSGEKMLEEYKELWDSIISGKVWHGEFHNKKRTEHSIGKLLLYLLYLEKGGVLPIS